jgi:hypothetical protein
VLILPRYLQAGRDEAVSEATHSVAARTQVAQTLLRRKGVNVYRCPVCHKEFRHDDEYEPACTGPNETTDDHPLAVMVFDRVEVAWKTW